MNNEKTVHGFILRAGHRQVRCVTNMCKEKIVPGLMAIKLNNNESYLLPGSLVRRGKGRYININKFQVYKINHVSNWNLQRFGVKS